jgi:hypothetical protein
MRMRSYVVTNPEMAVLSSIRRGYTRLGQICADLHVSHDNRGIVICALRLLRKNGRVLYRRQNPYFGWNLTEEGF